MPVYEYECMDCGCFVEVVQKVSDSPLEVCGTCSGRLSKLISQSSFHLKGGGWYVTDYKKGSNKPEPASGEAASPGAEKGSAE